MYYFKYRTDDNHNRLDPALVIVLLLLLVAVIEVAKYKVCGREGP
jgi:hypothetical protein